LTHQGDSGRSAAQSPSRANMLARSGAILAVAVGAVGLTGCQSSPCSEHRVVQARVVEPPGGPPGSTALVGDNDFEVELDDGHVYKLRIGRGPQTGSVEQLCAIPSKIDGSIHYSMGPPPGRFAREVERVR